MSRKISNLDSRFQPLVKQLLDESNKLTSPWITFITDGFRTYAEQAELYASGRTKIGKILTNAPPGTSNHEKGLAVDLAFQKDGKLSYEQKYYDLIVPIAKKLGIDWGGDWKFVDKPHFEKLKFETNGTIIEDVITNQTKIPQIDNKEVQQIRSEMLAKDNEIISLKITVQALNDRVSILEQNTPQNTSGESTGDSTPPVETPTPPSPSSTVPTWYGSIIKFFKELWNYD
jgi:peptidoglycan L-alanyl-D-glutamate endopeptidase CwlK